MAKQYETVIGLEVHIELATKTKIFCGCSTEFGGAPNTHTCPVCTGMPGSLPVLNKQVVEYAMAIGLATNCKITQVCKFDRKNYFYPDNPQNYQISQLYLPIARDGYVEIESGSGKKKVRIHEMHMEEDAGKLVHDEWDDTSLVDYNRSGVPLGAQSGRHGRGKTGGRYPPVRGRSGQTGKSDSAETAITAEKDVCVSDAFVKKPQIIRSTHNIGVRGEHFEVMFSVLNGGLVSYKYAGKEMIEAIPKPNFWRAPTDNDCGNLMQMRYAQWKIASMYLSHKEYRKGAYGPSNLPQAEETDHSVKVTFTYLMPTTPASECQLTYEVFGDGKVKTTLTYDPVKELGDMPEFGVIFKFNADYNNVQWYGLGEAETYADRKKGAKLGIYQNKIVDNIARYMVPQECGAKEEVRWAKVTDRKGRGMYFEMDGESMMFSALPYTPHEMENAMHPYELPAIHYTVVRAAKAQMGVGGDDSWGARTHPEYLLDTNGKMKFSFAFKGL